MVSLQAGLHLPNVLSDEGSVRRRRARSQVVLVVSERILAATCAILPIGLGDVVEQRRCARDRVGLLEEGDGLVVPAEIIGPNALVVEGSRRGPLILGSAWRLPATRGRRKHREQGGRTRGPK